MNVENGCDDVAPASEVYDRGRRGDPLPGCDCMQCFGYCMIDREAERRDMLRFQEQIATVPHLAQEAA